MSEFEQKKRANKVGNLDEIPSFFLFAGPGIDGGPVSDPHCTQPTQEQNKKRKTKPKEEEESQSEERSEDDEVQVSESEEDE